ncbi:MAG: hypothetical protein FJY65_08345 [Calditrichaeota bacterium]|nr:hypothetical protein [Calditrichota bacterium]
MERTLQILNDLVETGVIKGYAIGGAIGAFFYAEPVTTFDLDVFIELPQTKGCIVTSSPLYEALKAHGYRESGESVSIEGIPVQFLPLYNALIEEAFSTAIEKRYGQTSTQVFRVEYLIAICLQTGRDKDLTRVKMLLEQSDIDRNLLKDILLRYNLIVNGIR